MCIPSFLHEEYWDWSTSPAHYVKTAQPGPSTMQGSYNMGGGLTKRVVEQDGVFRLPKPLKKIPRKWREMDKVILEEFRNTEWRKVGPSFHKVCKAAATNGYQFYSPAQYISEFLADEEQF